MEPIIIPAVSKSNPQHELTVANLIFKFSMHMLSKSRRWANQSFRNLKEQTVLLNWKNDFLKLEN